MKDETRVNLGKVSPLSTVKISQYVWYFLSALLQPGVSAFSSRHETNTLNKVNYNGIVHVHTFNISFFILKS